jgi:hypothetical protein
MVVEIINITDGPHSDPELVEIYSKTLSPGESIKIPAELVDERLRQLAEGDNPKIAIGQAPSWYLASKIRRGKELTKEEIQKRFELRQQKKKPPVPPPHIAPPKEPEKKPLSLALVDTIEPEDQLERKSKRR